MKIDRSTIRPLIDRRIAAINEQCGEAFRVVPDGDGLKLLNGRVEITADWDFGIAARLAQIVKENGVFIEN